MPPREVPDRNLALELVRVTEAAALAAGRWVGMGDKEAADQAAVDGMHAVLHTILRYLLLAAALAPIVLLYIVIRDHELSWPRGEMTAVIGIIAFGLVVYNGVIDRPGEPPSEIELEIGWWMALLGTILITVGGSYRASTTERPRKPPGVM